MQKQLNTSSNYTLKNVRLETGFEYDSQDIIRTKTDLFCIEIEEGKIKNITPNNTQAHAIDAQEYLMLPAFKDMHIHLDKTWHGLPWQAHLPRLKTVKDMIAYEQKIIPELLTTSVERAELLIDLLQGYGTHFARTHFNVDPTSGLKSLAHLAQALENKHDSFTAELVAFPQHGLYYTDAAALMKEAAQLSNIDFIGGLDPYSIDGNIEKCIDFTVQLALDYNKGIDIHLHEVGTSGLKAIHYLIEKVLENPSLRGKTFVSHAFALGHLSLKETEAMAEKLAAAKVGIASSIPFGKTIMPIPILKKYGVEVLVGNDNVQDHWSVFGSGSMLQKAQLIAELYDYTSEFDLSRTLQFATQSLLPLSNHGTQQWPKVGDKANLVLVNASCSAEAVARVAPVKAMINKGAFYWNK